MLALSLALSLAQAVQAPLLCPLPAKYETVEALYAKAGGALAHGVMEAGAHARAKHAAAARDDARTVAETTTEAFEALAAVAPQPGVENEARYRAAVENALKARRVHAALLLASVRADEDENRAGSNVSSYTSNGGGLAGVVNAIARANAEKLQRAAHDTAQKSRHALEDDDDALAAATRAYDRARAPYALTCAPAPAPSPSAK